MIRIWAEWRDSQDNKYQIHRVAIIEIFEDNTALIVHKKKFHRVPLDSLEYSQWSD